tara:strand:+ start:864 stop:1022 length:159 start_codon:yes stop_codon:yes gene_type:complete
VVVSVVVGSAVKGQTGAIGHGAARWAIKRLLARAGIAAQVALGAATNAIYTA